MVDTTAEWPTIEAAADSLNISVRTMWRHIERGSIEVRKRKMTGRKAANIVSPHDVQKLMPAPFVVRDGRKQHRDNFTSSAERWHG